MARRALIDYSGNCSQCGSPGASPARSVEVLKGLRLEVCQACAHRWRRYGEFGRRERSPYTKVEPLAVAAVRQGHPVRSVAKLYGMHYCTLYRMLREAGIAPPTLQKAGSA